MDVLGGGAAGDGVVWNYVNTSQRSMYFRIPTRSTGCTSSCVVLHTGCAGCLAPPSDVRPPGFDRAVGVLMCCRGVSRARRHKCVWIFIERICHPLQYPFADHDQPRKQAHGAAGIDHDHA